MLGRIRENDFLGLCPCQEVGPGRALADSAACGARPLDATNSEIFSGDVLVFPMNNTSVFPLPMENLFPFEEVKFPTLPFVSTHGRGTGAAFYSSSRGPLPWSIDHVAPETYFVARFR